ncbi:AraC family transcriptional regulator [Ideonella azotifigens]|nr:AraC family transcriptional regulator [Ideonella azotifigens]MCD2341895.1 AraC family transcriptional regulator [Ideonella azotifigens]
MDRLAALFERFSVSARTFQSGALCGINAIGEDETRGQLHVVRAGRLAVDHFGAAPPLEVCEPSLLLYPRPLPRRFITDAQRGADMVCAHIEFTGSVANPVAAALPDVVQLPLAQAPEMDFLLRHLFSEADARNCGRQAMLDRLFEALLIQLLRVVMDRGHVRSGMLAGLADPRLRNMLVSLHERPQQPWSLESLAELAGMSRTAFANTFRDVVGVTPGAYLQAWRIGLAQQHLAAGMPLKLVAQEVGYSNEAALSRAFQAQTGQRPGEWRRGASAAGVDQAPGSPARVGQNSH